jgi:hypothetical protein
LVQQEELQICQLAAEVIKLCKEAEAARLETLALDKELQISLLLGRLDLGSLEGQDLPLLEEASWEVLDQPNSHHLQHNNKPKHHELPQQWYKDFHKGHQQVNHKGYPKGHQQAHLNHQGDHQWGHQAGNHQQAHLGHQWRHLQDNHKQWHCKWDQHPMEAMEL